ncbi:MAG: efflux RND transporter permease subunit [Rhodospirillales bacterium]|nr:efflux RND transporter permease subunit [Rhodospirillales bacterium]
MTLGLSGVLTRTFIRSPLTPLALLVAIGLGIVALAALPREEEPQIVVPIVDIQVEAAGHKAPDVVKLVTEPLEDIVKGINGVEHVYSLSEDDRAVVTVRFKVGTSEDAAMVRVHDEIRANIWRIPIGIPDPQIVGRGINDVPIVTLTLSPQGDIEKRWDDNALHKVADDLLHHLTKAPDVGLVFVVGGRADQIRVEPDPERLALYGVTLAQLVDKVRHANRRFIIGQMRERGRALPVLAGQTLEGQPDIGQLLITSRDGRPVYVKDVARVVVGAKPEDSRVWHLIKTKDGLFERRPAVTIAVAKRKGANAVAVADAVLRQLETVRGTLIPPGVEVTVTRNYGATATEKSNELLFHLALATVSIVVLVGFALGWREGVVVLMVVPSTILLTLFASWLMGFTINRVSLFALIFSIGILVDDAIVVVENIARHWAINDGRERVRAAIEAVAEVGNPTIVATLTIVVALLPMMFVSGLMGPYMSPIPANASAAMLFSFFVAVTIAPWLALRLQRFAPPAAKHGGDHTGRLGALYRRLAVPLLVGRRRAKRFLLAVAVGTVVACLPFAAKLVTVKLLPFDNKSELQVIFDLPEGNAMEATDRALMAAADAIRDVPEITHLQLYVGTAAPFNFNGLVRHYYLRRQPWQGDIQVNLLPKGERARQSHAIALEIRRRLAGLPALEGVELKIAEVPPGPPVLGTLMAEIYGPDADTRREAARRVRRAFEAVDFVVDVDDSFGAPAERLRIEIEQESLEYHGVQEQALYDTLEALLGGVRVGYSHRGPGVSPVEIAVRLPKEALVPAERLLTTPVAAPGEAADTGANVEIGDVVRLRRERASYPLYRRDGRFADLVTAELAGRFEAPIYGMLAVGDELARAEWAPKGKGDIRLHGQPVDESKVTLLWDGEWEITYVTFRDMGLAFAFALFGIYVLVVAQFGSFLLPLVVLTPVPLTLIGLVFGHWLFSAPFTATSMIGFIALAGIIVRNSILLVDFIRRRQGKGAGLRDVLLEAGSIRIKPIVLTAAAAMTGAAFILLDPIFQGLAISLVFGLASSTALTMLTIPALYVWLRDDGRPLGDSALSGA